MIKDVEKEVKRIAKWINKKVEEAHAAGVVVGNSGGKDSATVIALAQKALGKENVLAVMMPCQSLKSDIKDAELVVRQFDVNSAEIDLSKAYENLENEIDQVISPIEEWRGKESKINSKPRLRMTTLYYIAQSLNYLVIGTSNKCEITVGYTTKWGDNVSDLNPLAEFTVEEVLQIGKYLGVPEKIINKAPCDGLGKQTDEEKLGVTYKQIAEYIETGKTENDAMEIIQRKARASEHKRRPIPVYKRLKSNM